MTEPGQPGSRKLKHAVVVDAGTEWFKAVRIDFTRGSPEVKSRQLVNADPASGPSGADLATALGALGGNAVPVLVCLPRQIVNVRILDLPSTDPREIADMVDLQAGKQTSHSRDEITYDYKILGMGHGGYSRALVAIVQRGMLGQRFQCLEEAGAQIAQVTVSTEALLGWGLAAMRRAGESSTVVLLDVDASASELLVISPAGLLFSRSILVGAREVASGAAALAKLADEVKSALDMGRAEMGGHTPARLIVTGADRVGVSVAQEIGGRLGLRSEFRDAFEGMSAAAVPQASGDELLVSLASVAGVAAAFPGLDLNLVPDSVLVRRRLIGKARQLSAAAALLMAALLSASAYGMSKLAIQRRLVARLRAEHAAAAPAVLETKRKGEVAREVGVRRSQRLQPIRVLAGLKALTPEGAFLHSVDIEGEKGEGLIEGSAIDTRTITALKDGLESDALFSDVKEVGAARRDDATGRYRFQMSFRLENKP